jgi:hypothetical protein
MSDKGLELLTKNEYKKNRFVFFYQINGWFCGFSGLVALYDAIGKVLGTGATTATAVILLSASFLSFLSAFLIDKISEMAHYAKLNYLKNQDTNSNIYSIKKMLDRQINPIQQGKIELED